ncbi:hypothetical protein HYQ46_003140 [Verticillium longisporum]|nr:hypothetical protein HYQ44_016538 [Verticillium longisporum]KAG7148002.1 hypothetical protein HYQ46_003140 [Verticillium longisporum]
MASSTFITISLNPGFLAAPAGPREEPPPRPPSSSNAQLPPRASQAQAQSGSGDNDVESGRGPPDVGRWTTEGMDRGGAVTLGVHFGC